MRKTKLTDLEHQVVMGWKVRDHGQELEPSPVRCDFAGVVMYTPVVGQSLVVFCLAGDALRTSTVRGVSVEDDGSVLVDTMNSTYRLVLGRPAEGMHQAA